MTEVADGPNLWNSHCMLRMSCSCLSSDRCCLHIAILFGRVDHSDDRSNDSGDARTGGDGTESKKRKRRISL